VSQRHAANLVACRLRRVAHRALHLGLSSETRRLLLAQAPLFAARARDETREHHSVAPGRTLLPLTAATTPEYQVRSDPQ
jgi:hypothetical protein